MAATSWKGVYHLYSLAVILIVCGRVCFAAASDDKQPQDDQDARFTIYAGIAAAREHAKSLRVLTGYNADPGECGDVQLGPLPEGQYSGKEAWLKLIGSVCHVLERPDGTGGTRLFADMNDCRCSFGLPRFGRLQENQMLVTGSSLSEFEKSIPSSVLVIDRKRIRDIGAASVPDLLRYISQTAFHRGPGFRASGAQYAELRGLGAAYTLVLLNGRRAFGTAADLATSAFDLSVIPIGAVERLEISMDANSLVHGMDAIGGIVNVVLKDSVEPTTEVRYGAASGGAMESHASVSLGAQDERRRFSVFFDFQRWGELLGSERDRWNNQDFRRFGGLDYRAALASPLNVRSLDGQNLPGLDAPFAAAELNPVTGRFDYVAGQFNLTGFRRYQAIVPESSRMSVSANGSIGLGESTAYMELLGFTRENELQLTPPLVIGGILGANHPENPFGTAVMVDALLAGLPATRSRFETDSTRVVGVLSGPLGGWKYSTFVARSDEQVRVNARRSTSPIAMAGALSGDDPNNFLSLYSTLWRTAVPDGLIVDSSTRRYKTAATHMQASIRGSVWRLPAGNVSVNLGVERRRESMDFDPRIGPATRDITSGFVHLRVPVIGPDNLIPGVKELALLVGSRLDDYSDVSSIRKEQYGLVWDVSDSIKVHASTSGSFRPPSLVDLNLPRMVRTTQIFDPRRGEAVPVELRMGGNPDLQPSSGRSNSVGITFQPDDGWRLSAEYWRVKVRDHISVVAASSLLTQEKSALPGRIVRAEPSAADVELERPGRLLLLDVTRANVGAALTQGVDLAAEADLKVGPGILTPRLMVTLTGDFDYSEQPTTQIQMENRVGVASDLGTIPSQRAVASLAYESDNWRAAVNARVISTYRDRSDVNGQPMQRKISGGAVWDLNVSRRIAGNFYVTLGAFNLTNREPPFARAGGSLGFDASQGDLEGREWYGAIRGTF